MSNKIFSERMADAIYAKDLENEKVKSEMKDLAGKLVPNWIGLLQGVFILLILSSPFFWLWLNWATAWRVALTGIIGTVIMYIIYRFIRSAIIDAIIKKNKSINL